MQQHFVGLFIGTRAKIQYLILTIMMVYGSIIKNGITHRLVTQREMSFFQRVKDIN